MATSDFERVKQGIERFRRDRDIIDPCSGHGTTEAVENARKILMSPEEPSGLRRRAMLAMSDLSFKNVGTFVYVGRHSGDPKLVRAAVFHLTRMAERAGERGDMDTLKRIQTGLDRWQEDFERPNLSKLEATVRFHLPKPEEAAPEPNPGLDPDRNRAPGITVEI